MSHRTADETSTPLTRAQLEREADRRLQSARLYMWLMVIPLVISGITVANVVNNTAASFGVYAVPVGLLAVVALATIVLQEVVMSIHAKIDAKFASE